MTRTALLLIDVINPLDFEGAEALVEPALAAADRIAELKRRLGAAGVPAVYVNDNFDDWSTDFRGLVDRVADGDAPGRDLVRRLRPSDGDLYVLKPRHSGFHSTPLEILLDRLGAERLVLCGFQTHICVLATAQAAHMREFELIVPRDCSAAEREDDHTAALRLLRRGLNVDTRPGAEIEP